jgi:hypothetical protein
LREGVSDVPVAVCCSGRFAEGARGREAFVEALFEALDFVDIVTKVVAGATRTLVLRL